MNKYIDADEFVKEMNDRIDAAIKWGVNAIAERNEKIKTRAEQAVATFCEASLTAKKMPAADVVAVVRCRECANRYTTCPMALRMPTGGAPFVSFIARDDDYCSYGERRDE